MQHKKAYYIREQPLLVTPDTLHTDGGTWYGGWVNDVRTYQKAKIELPEYDITVKAGATVPLQLNIINPYPYEINFTDMGYEHHVALEACVLKEEIPVSIQRADDDFNRINLKPGQNAHFTFNFAAPIEKRTYKLLFSLRTDPFPGSKNSRIINLTVE
jgi:hypothetical protein